MPKSLLTNVLVRARGSAHRGGEGGAITVNSC